MNCADIATLAPLYLSGELDAARASAIDAHLRSCAACAREIEQQRDLDARLRGVLLAEDEDSGRLAVRIQQRVAAEGRRRNLALSAVAAVLFLALGFGLYKFIVPPVPLLAADAVQDHRREVVGKQIKKWRADAAEIDGLAERQGIPASALPALAAAGYRLDRARLCRLDGNIFLHLVYTDGAREMSVFLRPRKGDPAPQRDGNLGPQHFVAVQSGSMTVVCVAEESQAALNMARSAAAL